MNTEKNPKRCDELKIVASSNKIKFWSAPPPRTLKPDCPSPALVTPGNVNNALIISTSPRTTGIFLIVAVESLLTLISGLRILVAVFSVLITTSSNSCPVSIRLKFFLMSFSKEIVSSMVS